MTLGILWLVFGSISTAFAARPSIQVESGTLSPSFKFGKHDYAVRCEGQQTLVRVLGAPGWRTRIDDGSFRHGDLRRKLDADSELATKVTFRKRKTRKRSSHYLRCLPADFPVYSFERAAPGGPDLFSLQLGWQYAAIFDRNGVPVWWYKASGEPDNFQVLTDGTIAFDPVDIISYQTGDYEIRTLDGNLLRVIGAADGAVADIHEIELLPNGNYVIGGQVVAEADASSFGGALDSTVLGIEIQELTPDGDLVWQWNSNDHIGLEETGRWWNAPILDDEPYDVVHWNSSETSGNHVLLSMRHTDSIYKVDRRTGEIVWKLGGTETEESLEVTDPYDYPLGGQHDARLEPDGSITVYDNRTGLGDPPRALRYRINESAGTARLVQSIDDPRIADSFCCGSARRLDSGDWLIGWGGNGLTGAYDASGNPIFSFELAVGFSYRSIPVPEGAVTMRALRDSMDAMAAG